MQISELISLAESRLMSLNQDHLSASRRGDVSEVQRIEGEISETQRTLDTLRAVV